MTRMSFWTRWGWPVCPWGPWRTGVWSHSERLLPEKEDLARIDEDMKDMLSSMKNGMGEVIVKVKVKEPQQLWANKDRVGTRR